MLNDAKYYVLNWSADMQRLINQNFGQLDPTTYCIGAVFIICIGFVLLSGRR